MRHKFDVAPKFDRAQSIYLYILGRQNQTGILICVCECAHACALMPLSKSRIDCNGISSKIRPLSERSVEIPLTFIITTMGFKFFEKYFLDMDEISRHLNLFLLILIL